MDQHSNTIEKAVELIPLPSKDEDVFTNTHPLWSFAGGRGAFGGSTIAQCLVAAQHTVAEKYTAHSIQATFVSPANPGRKIEYFVHRIRDGKGFVTRTVQAIQDERIISTAIVSFVHSTTSGKGLQHTPRIPNEEALVSPGHDSLSSILVDGPFECRLGEDLNGSFPFPLSTG